MDQHRMVATRDLLRPHLAKIARLLKNPTPQNVNLARSELERLAQG